jgi:hypothetical protein
LAQLTTICCDFTFWASRMFDQGSLGLMRETAVGGGAGDAEKMEMRFNTFATSKEWVIGIHAHNLVSS